MGVVHLFVIASIPVLKVLLITALGLFLALDRVDILGEGARKHLNTVAFFVFNPALVGGNLAKTVTFDSFLKLWFMPFNILITFLVGSAAGWILCKITNAPNHLKGLILGACSAGNLGNMLLIIIPALCKEKGSPLGEPDACHSYGLAYASLSMAIGAIYLWSYVYNIVRISTRQAEKEEFRLDNNASSIGNNQEASNENTENCREPLLPCKNVCSLDQLRSHKSVTLFSSKISQQLKAFAEKINLRALLAPSTTAAIVGFIIGMIPLSRNLLIGSNAPLRVIEDSASMIGDAAIPAVTLILGANLLRGLKGSSIQVSIVVGIVAVRYIFLPVLGIFVVKGAIHLGLVSSDPLYQFVLLLQYAVPPAMNIGTITQLFGGQSECSVIMLWTYSLASVSLTLWSTCFLWLVS